MSRRLNRHPSARRRLVGALTWAGPTGIAALGLGLSLSRPRFDHLVTGHEVGDAAMAVACALVGALILSRRRRHPVGVTFLAIGTADAFSSLASGIGDRLGVGAAGYRWGVWFAGWVWIPGLLLTVTVLPLVFPEGLRSRAQRRLLRTEAALIGVVCVGMALAPRLASGPHSSIVNPLAVPGAGRVGDAALGLALLASLVSLTVLVVRLVKADERLRRQLLPLFAAAVAVVAAVMAAPFLGTPGVVLQDSCFLLIPGAALLSVLGLRLYDLELAIGRATGWVVLSGLLVGGYVLVVQLAATWLHVHGWAGSAGATAIIALLFGPLHSVLQKSIARWLYGDRGDPYAALAHTTQVLSGGADPAGALRQAADDLAHRLRTPGVRILSAHGLLAGTATGEAAMVLPLRSGDVEVGWLEVLPRAPGESFSAADQRLILDLSAPLANAVEAVGLTEELRVARERLAFARESERRRVRTELHDDVGPSLAAAAVQGQTALRRLQKDDTGGAAEALALLLDTIRRASADLRTAVDALGPGVLDEVGLVEAVRSLAWAGEPPVEVEVGPMPPLPAAVEVAVYRVIAEALANARRHSAAGSVTIQLGAVDGRLAICVSDDGVGGAASRPGGIGISSMRARVEELGGRFTLGPAAGGRGTAVTASVPFAAARPVVVG